MKKQEYLDLVSEVEEHNYHYYVECRPIISDQAFDKLLKKLEAVEQAHPEWIVSYSPTQRVGESLTKGFQSVKHTEPMLSLSNTYSEKEVVDFIKRVYKLLGREDVPFCVELKMDGTAVALRYEKGLFTQAMTRGNGRVGDDITHNVRTIQSIPLKLKGKDLPDFLEVRGEAYMPKSAFEKLNRAREKAGKELFANPRNATAGTLKLLNPKLVAERDIHILFYGVVEKEVPLIKTQSGVHTFLKKLGLPVGEERHFKVCKSVKEILDFAEKIEKERAKLSFEIDGVVIKVDDLKEHKTMGATAKSPRWATAYKFAAEQAESRIEKITVQVGRTGVLTPVAELTPTPLAGSKISRATLHNEEEVHRKDIREGDAVIIEKGGDVIPKVVSVIKEKRPKSSKAWKMPAKCPICGTAVARKEGEVAVRCPNKKSCGGQSVRRMIFFASRNAMDIEHLGQKVVEKLIEGGLVQTFADFYKLTPEDVGQLEGFKEKSIHNLLASIDSKRVVPLSTLIFAIGIPHVGAGTAELLAEHAGSLKALSKAGEEDLAEIEGIGPIVARSVVEFFADPVHQVELKALEEVGVVGQHEKIAKKASGHPFSGKTFVLTGTLDNYTRSEASALIKERGGKTSSSVSSKTDYVLVGHEAGSKLDKAEKLGIKILDEKAFEKLL